VICAYPVNDIYNLNHRALYYLALGLIVLGPVHRWLTPAALSIVVLYSLATTFYVGALYIAPNRLGPTLDVFPLHSILLTNTYAMAACVFCRSSMIKGKRRWAMVTRMFIWLWGGFMLAGYVKSSFEKKLTSNLTTVDCSENSTLSGNTFSAAQGLTCQNPCSTPGHSAIIWGSLDLAAKTFSAYPRPDLSTCEYLVVVAFSIALSATLWLNFYTSPQTTRNAVFAIFTRSRRDARGIRSTLAKTVALAWYTWSYLCLLMVALALPFVAWVQEELLKRYPVANTMCLVKQFLPWVLGTVVGLCKVVAIRRRRKEAVEARNSRRTRLNNALANLRLQVEQAGLPEQQPSAEQAPSDITTTEQAAPAEKSEPPKTFKMLITKARKINGFFDHFGELREWWTNPTGEEIVADSLPTVDEEKALLKDHYEQQE